MKRLVAGLSSVVSPVHAGQLASGRASAASTRQMSSAQVAVGLSASNQPKNPRCDFVPGASTMASSWMATSECSCCRRSPGRPVARAADSPPARVARPWNWSASVDQETALPSEPMTVHGQRPPIDWFCREATATPFKWCVSGAWSTYWLT